MALKNLFLMVFLALPAFAQNSEPIAVAVDATDVTRRLIHSHLTFPVKPGDFALQYPEWIPGEHGPTGPVTDVVGLKITSGSQNAGVASR
jgi:hypothetical protein